MPLHIIISGENKLLLVIICLHLRHTALYTYSVMKVAALRASLKRKRTKSKTRAASEQKASPERRPVASITRPPKKKKKAKPNGPSHQYIHTNSKSFPLSDTAEALRLFMMDRPEPETVTAAHESSLLYLSGSRPSTHTPCLIVDLPMCSNQGKCVGVTQRLRGFTEAEEGHPIMSMMTKKELSVLMRTGVKPAKTRPCLLCYRHRLGYLIMALYQSGTPVHRDIELPSFYCDVGPGGYHPSACHMPGEYVYIGIKRPVPAFRLDMLRVVTDNAGCRYVSQREMLWDFRQGTTLVISGLSSSLESGGSPGCPKSLSPLGNRVEETPEEEDTNDLFIAPRGSFGEEYADLQMSQAASMDQFWQLEQQTYGSPSRGVPDSPEFTPTSSGE